MLELRVTHGERWTVNSQFDELAQVYERTAEERVVRRYLEYSSYMTALGDVSGLTVMDIGCGSGVYTRRLRAAGAARAVGVDESEGMVKYARDRESREKLGVEYLVRDVTHPSDDGDAAVDGVFDLVAGVYVTPYCSTVEGLRGLFVTARRALPAAGGRFVTYALNPEVATTPGYYADYNLDIVYADPAVKGDGAPVSLTLGMREEAFPLVAYRWSRPTQESAARAAGFHDLRWIHPKVTEDGLNRYGKEFWQNYLDCPHALILECVAGPQA